MFIAYDDEVMFTPLFVGWFVFFSLAELHSYALIFTMFLDEVGVGQNTVN